MTEEKVEKPNRFLWFFIVPILVALFAYTGQKIIDEYWPKNSAESSSVSIPSSPKNPHHYLLQKIKPGN